MDYKEFSSKIKTKYPQYANLDDKDLAQKMIAKYPQYDVTFDEAPKAPAAPQQAAQAPEQPQQAPTKQDQQGQPFYQPIKDMGARFAERANRIGAAPTIPEKALRTAGGAAESLGDLVLSPLATIGNLVAPSAAQAIPEAAGKVNNWYQTQFPVPQMTTLGGMLANTDAGKKLYDFSQQPRVKENMRDLVSVGSLFPAEKAVTTLGKVVPDAAKAVSKMPVNKVAGTVAADMKKAVSNERGLVRIPDIDDPNFAKDLSAATETAKPLPKNMRDIKKNIGEPPKKGYRNYQLKEDEQQFLSRPEGPEETPFPIVMQQAQAAKKGQLEGVLTPLDIAAAEKGGEALRRISAKKAEVGKIKGDLVQKADEYLTATGQFANATPIQQKFKNLVAERLGGSINAQGKVVDAAGRILNESAQKPLIEKMYKTIDKLRPETTLKELDDVVMDLRNLVDDTKSTQTKQIFNKVDGIGEEIRGDIKKLIDSHISNSVDWGGAGQFLGPKGSETLKKSLQDYANISKIEDRLNRGLGEVVDPVSGQAKMGASLLKSSLMSNSDRGTKALFRAVNDLTGIDLMRAAGKAKIAMEAVGDNRIADLLQEAGVIRSALTGDKTGALMKLGEKGFNVFTGEKPDQLLRFYREQQKRYKTGSKPQAQNPKSDAVSLKDIGR